MRTKWNGLFVVVITALLLSACSPAATPAPKLDQTSPRLIHVTGTGKVLTQPDIAYIAIGVHTEEDDVKTALQKNNSQAQAVGQSLKDFQIEAKDIQTSSFNVYPQVQYGPNGVTLGTKYVVENTVTVTVRDLTRIGEILDSVVKSGANNINSIQFDIADKTKISEEARQAAMQDARNQAEELTAATGTTLGKVQTIEVLSSTSTLPNNLGMGGAMMAADVVPVSAGQIAVTVQLSVSFAIQ